MPGRDLAMQVVSSVGTGSVVERPLPESVRILDLCHPPLSQANLEARVPHRPTTGLSHALEVTAEYFRKRLL